MRLIRSLSTVLVSGGFALGVMVLPVDDEPMFCPHPTPECLEASAG